jgi:hypothetical protein
LPGEPDRRELFEAASQVNFAASKRAAAFSCGVPISGAKAALDAGMPKASPSGGATVQR